MNTSPLDGVQLRLVDTIEDAFELLRWLSTVDGPLAIDTESTGLSPETDRVRLSQLGDANTGWAMDHQRWSGVMLDACRKWAGDGKTFVMHNAKFDFSMLNQDGISIPRHLIHDTRLMAHTLHSTESTALKSLTARYVDSRAAAAQSALDEVMKTSGKGWADIPIVVDGVFSMYWQYGALDTVLTRRLYDVLWPQIQTEQVQQSYALDNAFSWVAERMERKGVAIDREYASKARGGFLQYVQDAEQWCLSNYDCKPSDNAKIVSILKEAGHQFTKRTKGGAISLDREVLEAIDHPLAQTVLSRRQHQKAVSSFIDHFLELSEHDGRVHPRINVVGGSGKTPGESGGFSGVRTGRTSMDNPNMTALTRTGTNAAGDSVRNCVVPTEGGRLLTCDFDQIEMRVMAHLSGCKGMVDAFKNTTDFFTALARRMYDDPDLQKSDPRRQSTKSAGYAQIYMSGVSTFAHTAGIPESTAADLMGRFNAEYPEVGQFQQWILKVAKDRAAQEGKAYVRTPARRKLVADPGREYALVDYLVQGRCAEILKSKALELDAAGVGEFLILPVHDEFVLDVPEDRFDEVARTVSEVMNDSGMMSVPLTAGLAAGYRWGEKREIEVSS